LAAKIDKGHVVPFGQYINIGEGQANGLIIYSSGYRMFIEYTGMNGDNPRGLRLARDPGLFKLLLKSLSVQMMNKQKAALGSIILHEAPRTPGTWSLRSSI
jgi:hypothetical protein